MDEPIKASKVEKVDTERTSEQVEKQRAKRAVASRLARRAALKKAGVKNVGNPALAENIADSLEDRVRATTKKFRARKAAEEAVASKRRAS